MSTTLQFIRSVADLFMTTRPVVLIPVWGFSALGFRAAVAAGSSKSIRECWGLATMSDYGMLLTFSLSVAAVYIINQIADIEADKKNGGLPLVASGIVSVRAAYVTMILCSAVAILLPLLLQQPLYAAAAALSITIGFVYSVKPFRLSGRPLLDFISNAIGYGVVAFAVGWIAAGRSPLNKEFIIASLPYLFLMSAGSISSTIPDITGDKEDYKFTTAVVFGVMSSHVIAMSCLLVAIATGIINRDTVAVTCATLSLPVYLLFLLHRTTALMEATYKVGGAICMIAAFVALPLFIPVSLVVFLATWLYFRIRHGVNYPSLVPTSTKNR